MAAPHLTGKRILVLGAETELGGQLASALAATGATVAAVAATPAAEAAFAVQRLGRRTGAVLAQAIDATNEMAVRVMVRQVAKALGGLDAVVFAADMGDATPGALELALRLGGRQMARSGGDGRLIVMGGGTSAGPPTGVELHVMAPEGRSLDEVTAEVVSLVAGGPDNR